MELHLKSSYTVCVVLDRYQKSICFNLPVDEAKSGNDQKKIVLVVLVTWIFYCIYFNFNLHVSCNMNLVLYAFNLVSPHINLVLYISFWFPNILLHLKSISASQWRSHEISWVTCGSHGDPCDMQPLSLESWQFTMNLISDQICFRGWKVEVTVR